MKFEFILWIFSGVRGAGGGGGLLLTEMCVSGSWQQEVEHRVQETAFLKEPSVIMVDNNDVLEFTLLASVESYLPNH